MVADGDECRIFSAVKDLMVKDGYKFAAAPLLCGLVALFLHWNWLGGVLLVLGAFVLYFFRDPQRTIPADPDAIVSPADGRVMEVVEEPFGGTPGCRISVFLSIFDVHVNRTPVAGRISEIQYRKGQFYAAMRGRASEENEQNVIHVSSERGEVVFKQIAGWIARRILCWKAVGDSVTRGERVGMIRFGSRVDIWLPAGAEILVRPGQHVAGGSSVLARWR
jgi:phosphatidylserine decarboxylase